MKKDEPREDQEMRPEYDFAGGVRGKYADHFPSRESVSPRTAKVRITMYVDADVVEEFKRRASVPNSAPYQSQINDALRRSISSSESPVYAGLLNSPEFIQAVAERVRGANRSDRRQRKTG